MMLRYSIAEARNHFAEIVHDLKHVSRVEATWRGRPVAHSHLHRGIRNVARGNVTFAMLMKRFGTRTI